ncbi:hypothetical protein MTR_0030s0280 [Medicago truncatula]|uniref:Uncharacterized protein n=1 Tax=Medicago truncatula TaxID=3880 RepID=A0A072TK13_MEDTR|nr:hypothetical protein MTR_0030s0280 [Medicago truncatula]
MDIDLIRDEANEAALNRGPRVEVQSLGENLTDTVPNSEATPLEPVEEMVLAELFTTSTAPPPPPRERSKRHWSRESEEDRSRKKERT